VEALRSLLDAGIPISATHPEVEDDMNCVQVACQADRLEALEFLLARGGKELILNNCFFGNCMDMARRPGVLFALIKARPTLAHYRAGYFREPVLVKLAGWLSDENVDLTVEAVQRFVDTYAVPVDVADTMGTTALTTCFFRGYEAKARELFFWLAREKGASLVGGRGNDTGVPSDSEHIFTSLPPAREHLECCNPLMTYLIEERGLDIDTPDANGMSALAVMLTLLRYLSDGRRWSKVSTAAYLIKWGASVGRVVTVTPASKFTSSPAMQAFWADAAGVLCEAIRERAWIKRARLVPAYRYPREHSNVRRWDKEEEDSGE
jgi:hypothetical protein